MLTADVQLCIGYLLEKRVFAKAVPGVPTDPVEFNCTTPLIKRMSPMELFVYGESKMMAWAKEYKENGTHVLPSCSRGLSFQERKVKGKPPIPPGQECALTDELEDEGEGEDIPLIDS